LPAYAEILLEAHVKSLTDHIVVVAGATGNVGPFIVQALLEREATIAVPSRSEDKLGGLRDHLNRHVGQSELGRLHTFVGDFSDESDATRLRDRIASEVGRPNAVVASVGDFVTSPSLLDATAHDLQRALDGSVIAHLRLAHAFLAPLRNSRGRYVILQGPLAFELRPEFGTHLVSIATAAQHMLFRALAQELDGSSAHVTELVIHAFIRGRQTQPGSAVAGEAVGAFAADLLSAAGEDLHGQSIHLHSTEQLADVDLAGEHLAKERA
jgi:NAD(P)-dependent dehydrogenase (short-subunit alcohol dehydrogenase family)